MPDAYVLQAGTPFSLCPPPQDFSQIVLASLNSPDLVVLLHMLAPIKSRNGSVCANFVWDMPGRCQRPALAGRGDLLYRRYLGIGCTGALTSACLWQPPSYLSTFRWSIPATLPDISCWPENKNISWMVFVLMPSQISCKYENCRSLTKCYNWGNRYYYST